MLASPCGEDHDRHDDRGGDECDAEPGEHDTDCDTEPVREREERVPAGDDAAPEVVGPGVGRDLLGDEVDGDGREVDLVDEPVPLLGEAVEFRLASRQLGFDRDEVCDRGRRGEQLAEAFDRGGERVDAGVEVLALLRDIRRVHRDGVHSAEFTECVDELVEFVGGDTQGERRARRLRIGAGGLGAVVHPTAGLLGQIGGFLGLRHRIVDGDRDPARRDDAAIGELRLGCTARGILGGPLVDLAGLGRDLARRRVDGGHVRVGCAAHSAAGEEQCGDRGRCRRGCESSSHALTVLPCGNPMSGARLGVRSRSDCASL